MKRVVIFTDLDGTLLDADTYSFEAALPALRLADALDTPIVICSSKTRKEIELLRQELNNRHPFIMENGGGIVIPPEYFDPCITQGLTATTQKNEHRAIRLGARYTLLRRALRKLRAEGFRITGFGDMSVAEVAELTKLPCNLARLAREREFDEPFVFEGDEAECERLGERIRQKGLRLTEGRFFHLLGESDKGKATAILIRLFQQAYGEITTIALGDSANDLPMLEQVDRPIVVRKPDGRHDTRIDVPRMVKAEGIGPEGWNSALLELFAEMGLTGGSVESKSRT